MSTRLRASRSLEPSVCYVLMLCLLAVLWLAGGASRADATGQMVVRAVCAGLLIVTALLSRRLSIGAAKPVALLLLACILLVTVQLIPLPPSVWMSLPGRDLFAQAMPGAQPWRPWSIVPGATLNAAFALLVPVTTLVLASGLRPAERQSLLSILVLAIFVAMLMGLLQFAGVQIDNPFINDTRGAVSGNFANRNHFALLLALGCLVAPVWVFLRGNRSPVRELIAFSLIILFLLGLLATGSRSGMLLGLLGLVLGFLIVRRPLGGLLQGYPRWVFWALIAGVVISIAILILVSIAADRAVSIERAMRIWDGMDNDMRLRGLPVVVDMIKYYFPFGAGYGTFDPMFRIHEPFDLLKPSYFNHAHNDFAELVIEGGAAGVLVLLTALAWYGRASVRVWRRPGSSDVMLGRLGSAMLVLVLLASVTDYAARTPIIEAMIILSAAWLSWGENRSKGAALPEQGQHL